MPVLSALSHVELKAYAKRYRARKNLTPEQLPLTLSHDDLLGRLRSLRKKAKTGKKEKKEKKKKQQEEEAKEEAREEKTSPVKIDPTWRPELKDFLTELNKVRSHLAPKRSYPIDWDNVFRWAKEESKSSGDEMQHFVEVVASGLIHISFAQFLERLREAAELFQTEIDNDPYVLVLPTETCKSSKWVAQLLFAHRMLPFMPVEIVNDTARVPKSIRKFLFVDDAIYSGTQMHATIYSQFKSIKSKSKDVHVFLIAPFVTTAAIKLLRTEQITILYSQVMKTLLQVGHLLEKPRTMLTRLTKQPLIYFDHKLPDTVSTSPGLLMKFISGCGKGDYDCPPPPYKKAPLCHKDIV